MKYATGETPMVGDRVKFGGKGNEMRVLEVMGSGGIDAVSPWRPATPYRDQSPDKFTLVQREVPNG